MLKPDLFLASVIKITPLLLQELEVSAIILDVDNTIRQHKKIEIYAGVMSWVKKIRSFGFSFVIASNNFKSSVEPVAKILNLPYVSMCFKPFPIGLKKAAKKLGVSKRKIVVVGDQFFTDIIGGKLQGFKTILIKPIEEEKGFFWKIRRGLEKIILHKILR